MILLLIIINIPRRHGKDKFKDNSDFIPETSFLKLLITTKDKLIDYISIFLSFPSSLIG